MANATARKLTIAEEAQRLFFQIGMVQRPKVARALAGRGLTFPQAHALRLLDPEKPLPMSDLAEALVCDASNITGIADRLEARGLVERRAAEHDRRVKALMLTEAGVAEREWVLDLMVQPPAGIAALPLSDQRTLLDILRRAFELQPESNA